MFELSLPVQRFVIGCILLMILIIGLDHILDALWIWSDQMQDTFFQSTTI